jgi:hypothetical protein
LAVDLYSFLKNLVPILVEGDADYAEPGYAGDDADEIVDEQALVETD